MRTIVAGAFMTLDGVIQDPGGFGETEQGGWALPYFDDAAREGATEQVLASDVLLLGRRTYELLHRAWSQNTGRYAEALHGIRKMVVSETLHGSLPWNATALNGDPARSVSELQGEVLVYGSFTLVRTLLEHHLLDEVHVGVHPLLLGGGRRLFDGAMPAELRLVAATPSRSGVVALSYAP
ncbi:MAG: dihydrofolate reductase family protein [Phycicoccus sp.]